MRRTEFDISAAALLVFAVLWYLDDTGLLSAAVPALLAHEAGHFFAVRLSGGEVTGIKLTLCGAYMRCTPARSGGGEVLRCLAGPAAGALYALAASTAGRLAGSLFLSCSAGISLVLTAFNLLPHPELDGGRALRAAAGPGGDGITAALGLITSAALAVWGAELAERGYGWAMTLAGAMLLLSSLKGERRA